MIQDHATGQSPALKIVYEFDITKNDIDPTPDTSDPYNQLKTELLKNFFMCSGVPQNSSRLLAPAFCHPA